MPTGPSRTVKTMKSGLRSSEFWILFLVIVLTNFQASGILEPTHWGVKLATVIVNVLGFLGYNAKRAALKMATPAASAS